MKRRTHKIRIVAVVGPTSVGKTALGVYLAKKLGGEVISADSRQVYRGIDLISGKITKREMQGVPHHMLSVADPKKPYSVAQFVSAAQRIIFDISKKGRAPIIVGGTGFYVDVLLRGMTLPSVKPNPSLRRQLAKKSPTQLFAILKKLDPARARSIDRHNPVRLIRAIEVAKALGKVPKKLNRAIYRPIYIGLDLPDGVLKKKIRRRIEERLKKGMIAEANRLHESGLSYVRMRTLGLELLHLADLLEKKVTREEFINDLAMDIWHYAKRQRTWFKRNKNIQWLSPQDKKKAFTLARNFLR